MKVNGHGQAAILNPDELTKLFTDGFKTPRDRALFAICLYTGCRLAEALSLDVSDISGNTITFKKGNTKGKLATRQCDIQPGLATYLAEYTPSPHAGSDALFPGKRGMSERLTDRAADKVLRQACERVGLLGVSTHSFRRTALTMMANAGVPLHQIQSISGHNNLQNLQLYLETTPEQRKKALACITF